jgi:hypothetical protein
LWGKSIKTILQEEVNEANVQYVGGGFGSAKTEGFLPIPNSPKGIKKYLYLIFIPSVFGS